jgi:hypothetical protein
MAPGGDDTPWVFSGTLILAGEGLAEIQATGPRSRIGAIGTALAARFSAANTTPPAGYDEVRLATANPPDMISVFPSVVVFPPSTTAEYGPNRLVRQIHRFPVRFYVAKGMGTDRAVKALYAWRDVLVEGVVSDMQLGLPNVVVKALVPDIRMGESEYGGEMFAVIEMQVEVTTREVLSTIAP